MKFSKTKTRWLLCSIILIAFFIPSYNGTSAAGFISNAMAEAETHPEITQTDVLIVLTPLLLVPISVIAIFIRSYLQKRSVKIFFLTLPLLFTAAFLSILFFVAADGMYSLTSPKALLEMQVGFYIHIVACCLLIFTKKQRRKAMRFSEAVPAATV